MAECGGEVFFQELELHRPIFLLGVDKINLWGDLPENINDKSILFGISGTCIHSSSGSDGAGA